jgi:hypothetical protein
MSRFKRVDLDAMSTVRDRWGELAGEPLASRCEPEVVKDHVLFVRVPTGAYAEALERASMRIIEGLSDLGERAPTRLKIVVGDVTK